MADADVIAADAPPLLAAHAIVKRFGGVVALHAVGLHIARGEILGLIGPNGAGKTTLFNVLTGLYRADGGSFTFDGHAVTRPQPHRIAKLGIARTFQNIRLFSNMTALENVMIGRHVRTQAGIFGAILRTRRTRAEEAGIAERAHALLRYVGLTAHSNVIAQHLSYGDQRRLEIARALATEPKLLALDEPAAGMNGAETAALGELLKRIRADGTTLMVIEHNVKFMMTLCDRIVVLDYGKKIAEGTPAEIQRHPEVIAAYLGGSVGGNAGSHAGGHAK